MFYEHFKINSRIIYVYHTRNDLKWIISRRYIYKAIYFKNNK